jgi:DNA-binding PadR family transcriptional regulator
MIAMITSDELQQLTKNHANGSQIATYIAIKTFAYGDRPNCFPSIKTLLKRLGNAFSERTLYSCLKWLELKGFIQKNAPQTQKRFIINSKLNLETQRKEEVKEFAVGDEDVSTIITETKNINVSKQTSENPQTNNTRFERVKQATPEQTKKREWLEKKKQAQKNRIGWFQGADISELTKHDRTKQRILETKQADRNDLDDLSAVGELLDGLTFRRWFYDKVELSILLS